LARRIVQRRSSDPSAWFQSFPVGPEPVRLNLVCFPYAGAGAVAFGRWRFRGVRVSAVRLPGREIRLHEPRYRDVREAALDLVLALEAARITPPFCFFGHSLGALLAYEVCQNLLERGACLPTRLIVSGRAAPQLPILTRLYTLPLSELKTVVAGYGGTPVNVLNAEYFGRILLPVIRDDFEMAENYSHGQRPVLPLPIDALAGDQDPVAPRARVEAWRQVTSSEFSLRVFSGQHFFLHAHESAVLEHVDSLIREGGARAPQRACS